MAGAKVRFNGATALYECVTEHGTYPQVHVSGDVGLFQKDDGQRVDCLVYASGVAREASDGDEHEVDGVTYVATLSGWRERGVDDAAS